MANKTRRIRLGRPATWADLLDLPDDVIGEIVNGEIVVSSRPGQPHVVVASAFGVHLAGPLQFGIGGPGGWIILDEPRIRFGEEIRVPDLAGWRKERWPGFARTGPIVVVPDWICEVLSPGTQGRDRTSKLALYARAQVSHAWLVDPVERTLEIYRRQENGWLLAASFKGVQRVRAEPFEAIELDLALIWPELPPLPDDE